MATKKTTKSKVMAKKKTVKKTALKSSSKNLDKQFASKIVFEEPGQKAKEKLNTKAKLIKDLTSKTNDAVAKIKELKNKLPIDYVNIKRQEIAAFKQELKKHRDTSQDDGPTEVFKIDLKLDKESPTEYVSRIKRELSQAVKPIKMPKLSVLYQAKAIMELVISGVINKDDTKAMTKRGFTSDAIRFYETYSHIIEKNAFSESVGEYRMRMKKEFENLLQDPDIVMLESMRPRKEADISTPSSGHFSRNDAPVKKLTEKELEAARAELRKQRKPQSSANYAKQAKRIKELIDSGVMSADDLSVMTDYGITEEAIELYKQQYTRTKSLEEELDEAEAADEYVCVDEKLSGNVETGFFSRSGSLVEQTVNTHPTAKELGEVYKLESDAGDYYAGKLADSLKLANTPVELKTAIKNIEDFEDKYVQAVKHHLKTKRNLIVMETHLKKIYAELKNDQT